MARTNRRIYATRRKRMNSSPLQLGVDPNAGPSQSYNTGVAGGGGQYIPQVAARAGAGIGSMLGSKNVLGGFKPGTGVVGPGADLGSGSYRPTGMFSRVRARARRRMSELFETKTSVPPYLDDSSDSSGGSDMGGTYTITKA